MPAPVSLTRISAYASTTCKESVTRPPAGVNLAAFLSRLPIICAMRVGSTTTQIGLSGTFVARATSSVLNTVLSSSAVRLTRSAKFTRSSRSCILPRAILVTSSSSSTSRVTC